MPSSNVVKANLPGVVRQFGDLLESAPDAMVIVDGSGKIVLVNAQTERLFGYTREELLTHTVETLIPQRYRDRHIGHRGGYFEAPRTRGMGTGLELYGLRKDGSEFPVEISLSPFQTDHGTLVSSAIRDITERKQFEKALHEKNVELEKVNRAKDSFLAAMSHELRSPLNAIIGFTGTLLMRLPGPLTEEQAKQLEIVQSSARHLLSLINDMLDVARIESGKADLHFEAVEVGTVIDTVATALRPSAESKRLRLKAEITSDDLTLMTDRRALRQILNNLVGNAVKYTEKGSVHIRAWRKENGSIAIAVTDTGIGIKSEDRERLFEAFEQLDRSTTRRFEGVGLGLHLSRKLASLIRAELTVESEVGKGSTFTLTLPGK